MIQLVLYYQSLEKGSMYKISTILPPHIFLDKKVISVDSNGFQNTL